VSCRRARDPVAPVDDEGRRVMSGLEWILGFSLAVFYIFCIFTVAVITFQKGHLVLGFLGIFLPFMWLIGAILPDRHQGAGNRAGIA
jgi:hypothetical protein